MLRTHGPLQQVLSQPEVEPDLLNTWKDLVPAKQVSPDTPVWLLLADLVQKPAQSGKIQSLLASYVMLSASTQTHALSRGCIVVCCNAQ